MNFVLLALAWIGHLVWMVASHNYFWGVIRSKWLGDFVHLVHLLAVLALGPVVFWTFGLNLTGLLDSTTATPWQLFCQAYLLFCVLTAVLWLPLLTWLRARRQEPIRDRKIETVDVARLLARRPYDPSSRSFYVHFPGTQIFHIDFTEKTIALPRLPAAWNGLTLLHLSDLHFHGVPNRDYFRYVLDRCADWRPDVVALTGDLVDTDIHHRWLIPLLGRLRWNDLGLAILGNHDLRHPAEPIRRRLRRLGMLVPENTWHELSLRGEPLLVIGQEGPWLEPEPDLRQCPSQGFRLCLSHTPDNMAWACRHGIDLVLSGHVHGGQIRVPILGSVLIPSVYGRRYDQGTFAVGSTLLHVSRGISGDHPLRYGCRPEVTLLRLVRAEIGQT